MTGDVAAPSAVGPNGLGIDVARIVEVERGVFQSLFQPTIEELADGGRADDGLRAAVWQQGRIAGV